MRAIAFWFKQAATFHYNHTHREEEECDAPPVEIYFFHSQALNLLMGECTRKVLKQTSF
jgi:hypothetical protein